ncbi:MAG: 50S ribosomal protein L6 [Candidatus Brocadia sp. AMX2]|uniref:Large ribosomal subunit protein uL6 n=1 Tax=Candidatus Brocadia sinica JPN1 TaxID=1197129 RepID=A0ABQ0JYB0_9BACT|nr:MULTISPECIES: 50S ribosomal protein L6 [Brocadia]KXK26349.1 MAG: 50S ribosomal protein L6 [Candidatus Brocadia sinica]MBC6932921.1 50S ribosomal protein L6 [Candidatus Brocadia sp.]MBL1167593.1 50S ribosomal protein L6 [Candidatus Brocadia sp. AMX1]NOG40517.1 50S ribosomal protein L6 [Planctomycetota bacterium]KAA0242055.1 MAG: 50S ribosomal protein L6 [Candidatus Brocadia sp. AMX2]
MSRIGKQPVRVPDNVKLSIAGNTLNIEGPKGKLRQVVHPDIAIEYNQQNKQILIKRASDEKYHKALHGLTRALIANMITGVTNSFSKNLEIVGLGYNAKVQGKELVLSLGYTHPVHLEIPMGIKVDVTNPTNPAKLTVSGPDKQMVGQFSAVIRGKKPPEPYKGMGIKYEGEVIRRKAGKAFTSGAA